MKININNAEKIKEVLDKVQKRASARLVNPETIHNLADYAEKFLNTQGIPKKVRPGTRAEYCEKINCNAYSRIARTANSTCVVIERGTKDWFVVCCDRDEIFTRRSNDQTKRIRLSKNTQNWIRDNIIRITETQF